MLRITTDAELVSRMRDALKGKQEAAAVLRALPRMTEAQREDLQALDYDIYYLTRDLAQNPTSTKETTNEQI